MFRAQTTLENTKLIENRFGILLPSGVTYIYIISNFRFY
jgi:hypothetical protein